MWRHLSHKRPLGEHDDILEILGQSINPSIHGLKSIRGMTNRTKLTLNTHVSTFTSPL
jgi:hypothetical protein